MWTPTTRQQHSRPITRYQTDLTDAEWRVIAPYLPKPCATGRRREWPMREIINGIFYVMRAGCPWRLLPSDLPPWGTIYRTELRFCSIGLNLEMPDLLSARHSMRLSPALLNRSRRRAPVRRDLIPTRRQKLYSLTNHRCQSTGWLAFAAVPIRTLAAARAQAILSCPENVRGKPCAFRRRVRCRLGRLARCL